MKSLEIDLVESKEEIDSCLNASNLERREHKAAGELAHYALFDHVWLSPSLGPRQNGRVDRAPHQAVGGWKRHDPAWVVLDL